MITLRFLQMCVSENPEYPFQAGQTIRLPRLTTAMKAYVRKGWAVLLHEEPERAVLPQTERAVRR